MVSKLVSCVLNREFEPWLGQANDYNIGIYCELALSKSNGAGLSWTKQALSHDIAEKMLI